MWIKTRRILTMPYLVPPCLVWPLPAFLDPSQVILALVLCEITFFHFLKLSTAPPAIGPLLVQHAPTRNTT